MKVIFVIILTIIFYSCYTPQKAKQQFAKATVAYPKIASDYCANTYPVKDSIVKDTVKTTDTLYVEGEVTTDTVTINDTVRITTVKVLPGKVITNTIRITDTVYRENTAALKSCEIDKSSLISQLQNQTNKTETAQGKATKRGRIMWGLIALIALVIGYNVYRRLKPLA